MVNLFASDRFITSRYTNSPSNKTLRRAGMESSIGSTEFLFLFMRFAGLFFGGAIKLLGSRRESNSADGFRLETCRARAAGAQRK
mmetsp:Transcript_66156/g.137875  ORF Transcript_66156/g.137875 Transcript_66156/m.137875 type:complete len:85 (+) Transcript_66156:333-587(+)